MDRACKIWEQAAEVHTEGFVIPYLQGVCAEVDRQDLQSAYEFYQIAYNELLEPVTAINQALTRIQRKIQNSGDISQQTKKSVKRKPSQNVLRAQKALNELGYDAGPADGFMGGKTASSLKSYQEDLGLEATGQLSEENMSMLGL